MSARLKLKVFSPQGEDPEDEKQVSEAEVEAARQAGFEAGFAEGAAASAEEHANAQDQLRAGFLEILRDGQMVRAEAQAQVMQGILPLVVSLVEHLAPTLARAGLAGHVETCLSRALSERPDLKPILCCAPEARAALERALVDWSGKYKFRTDPKLTPLEVELHWDDGFDRIDLASAIDAVLADIKRLAGDDAEDSAITQETMRHAG